MGSHISKEKSSRAHRYQGPHIPIEKSIDRNLSTQRDDARMPSNAPAFWQLTRFYGWRRHSMGIKNTGLKREK